jgi:hypothetical protein
VITKQSILFEAVNVTLQLFYEILVVIEWIAKIVVLLILFQAYGGNKKL